MREMPERIQLSNGADGFYHVNVNGGTEYVRADLLARHTIRYDKEHGAWIDECGKQLKRWEPTITPDTEEEYTQDDDRIVAAIERAARTIAAAVLRPNMPSVSILEKNDLAGVVAKALWQGAGE